jgi:hypothetical protein
VQRNHSLNWLLAPGLDDVRWRIAQQDIGRVVREYLIVEAEQAGKGGRQ